MTMDTELCAETPYTYTVLLFGTEIERYCSSIIDEQKKILGTGRYEQLTFKCC